MLDGWLEGVAAKAEELALEAGGEPTAAEAALSVWMQAWREMLRKLASSVATLQAKVDQAAAIRRTRNQERLEKLVDGERKEAADRAIRQHENALEALEAGRERLRNAQLQCTIDQAAEEFGTRFEVVARAEADASDSLREAHLIAEKLGDALKPADELPRLSGPRKGRPSVAMEAYLAARRRQEFWRSTHEAIAARLRTTPSAEHNVLLLGIAQELVSAGKAYVISTRTERDAALALGRPRKVVEETELLAA